MTTKQQLDDCRETFDMTVAKMQTEINMLVEALRGILNSYDAPHKYNQSKAVIAARAALAKLEGK